ncbi:putative tRNA pseudouridine synthase [Acorus calamus]|uniref:tRNA pseudouridine synthase n=1 Tax=Acorus calamus TaxID=4465 RepID=A0AAV9F3L7_ACOCL|nr:putative tRNA pseudouridine synthase [Acorus calamus]
MDSSPEQKKLKMSSTTSDDDETPATVAGDVPAESETTKKKRYKRRKIAIFLAYSGHGYQGMQKNPGAKTIEGDLEEALYLSGAVPESDRSTPRRYDWARSARTDKGVSAAGQVVSGRFYVDPEPEGLAARLNSHLPSQIRVFGFKRVTGSFNAKKFCDRRRYVYLLPLFALDLTVHRDRESVAAAVGSENELSRCVECSERGRKAPGVMGRWAEPAAAIEISAEETESKEKRRFCYGEEVKERFNRVLGFYVGTHNFHNFTSRTKAEDPAAKRYIVSFTADSVVVVEGTEFVRCEVVGQSFMLHQIRKMVGLAVAVMRNCAPETLIETALRKDVKITVPTAPEVGLYLEESLFSSYNQKWKDSHEALSMETYAEQAEEFKMGHIYSYIFSMEQKEGAVGLWLHSLNHRNYPDFRFGESNIDCVSGDCIQILNADIIDDNTQNLKNCTSGGDTQIENNNSSGEQKQIENDCSSVGHAEVENKSG